MSKEFKQNIQQYISKTRWAILATVNKDSIPVQRVMGSFALDGLAVYFSTSKAADKVKQIEHNGWVSFYFQHEGQDLDTFKNVALIGIAREVKNGKDFDRGVELLSARNPRFKARVERGELAEIAVFRIEPKEVKYLDYANGRGKAAIQTIILEEPLVDSRPAVSA